MVLKHTKFSRNAINCVAVAIAFVFVAIYTEIQYSGCFIASYRVVMVEHLHSKMPLFYYKLVSFISF